MSKSKIEWTEESWNPLRARISDTVVGWHCEKVSAACVNCYAERQNLNPRKMKFNGTALPYVRKSRDAGELFLDEKVLLKPLHWKKPLKIFVCSMTDLFGEWVPDEWLDKIFAVMALCPQHTFQVLTKRPERMRAYLTKPHRPGQFTTILDDGSRIATPGANIRAHSAMCELLRKVPADAVNSAIAWQDAHYPDRDGFMRRWPLPNVWLGVTAENQEMADKRIPLLLATPAALRWVSCEPPLGPIELTRIILQKSDAPEHGKPNVSMDCLRGWYGGADQDRTRLDWVVAGGESGPHARPSHPDWFRSLRDQCAAAGVPFLFKQWGEWAPMNAADIAQDGPVSDRWGNVRDWMNRYVIFKDDAGAARVRGHSFTEHATNLVYRVGKKAAGRLLDGVLHDAYPEVRA